jgi:hypothetical protein
MADELTTSLPPNCCRDQAGRESPPAPPLESDVPVFPPYCDDAGEPAPAPLPLLSAETYCGAMRRLLILARQAYEPRPGWKPRAQPCVAVVAGLLKLHDRVDAEGQTLAVQLFPFGEEPTTELTPTSHNAEPGDGLSEFPSQAPPIEPAEAIE